MGGYLRSTLSLLNNGDALRDGVHAFRISGVCGYMAYRPIALQHAARGRDRRTLSRRQCFGCSLAVCLLGKTNNLHSSLLPEALSGQRRRRRFRH